MTGRVKEGSYYEVEAQFFDSSGAAVTPSSVRYQVVCLTTDKIVREWTTVSPGNTVSIIATATDNVIQDDKNQREKKQIVVQSDYDTDLQVTQSHEYIVENLRGVR